MNYRKFPLAIGHVYHIFTKSIAGFEIFNNGQEFMRMKATLKYYQVAGPCPRFSYFQRVAADKMLSCRSMNEDRIKLVQILAYCLMPTHLHLILKQLVEHGITKSMGNVLNSYARYFNTRHKRKGPLWESTFKNVLVKTGEQLLHLTRYLHINPTTAALVDMPENWAFSSYKEYLLREKDTDRICSYDDVLNIQPNTYKEFVEERICYQKELAIIKDLTIE